MTNAPRSLAVAILAMAVAWSATAEELWRLDVDAAGLATVGALLGDRPLGQLLRKARVVGVGHPDSAGAAVAGHLRDGEVHVATIVDTLANEPLLHDRLGEACGPADQNGGYRLGKAGPFVAVQGRYLQIAGNRNAIAAMPANFRPDAKSTGFKLIAKLSEFPVSLRPRAAALQGVTTLAIRAERRDTDWDLTLNLDTESPEQAQQTLQIANGLIAYAKMNREQKPLAAQIAASATTELENQSVRITVSTTQKLFEQILRRPVIQQLQIAQPTLAKP